MCGVRFFYVTSALLSQLFLMAGASLPSIAEDQTIQTSINELGGLSNGVEEFNDDSIIEKGTIDEIFDYLGCDEPEKIKNPNVQMQLELYSPVFFPPGPLGPEGPGASEGGVPLGTPPGPSNFRRSRKFNGPQNSGLRLFDWVFHLFPLGAPLGSKPGLFAFLKKTQK